MMQDIYNSIFGIKEAKTSYITYEGPYSIHYTIKQGVTSKCLVDEISINKKDTKVFACRLLGNHLSSLSNGNRVYNFCENSLITSITLDGKPIITSPNGINLDGSILGTEYKNGILESCDYDGKMFRRVEGTNLYIVYSMGSIDAYIHGVFCNIVSGQGKYIIVANGRIICHMISLDTTSMVHWSKNHEKILEGCYGYNPCNKLNLLPEEFFDHYYYGILKNANVTIPLNSNMVLEYSNPPRCVVTRDFYLLYEGSKVECMFGYQPNASIINGNIHGLISVGSEYYYHEGILQWIRDGSNYIVKYDDVTMCKVSIYKDYCIRDGKRYKFVDGYVSIILDDNSILDIFYDNGIPKMTTYSTVRNIEPLAYKIS
jgi:hypothetical protein